MKKMNLKKSTSVSVSLIFVLVMLFSFVGCSQNSASTTSVNSKAELIKAVKYDSSQPVYVIGHKSPDSDTVCSAIAYANLLKELGINAEARVSGMINNETKFVLEQAGVSVPEVLDNAADKQIVLVDHSKYSQAVDGMKNAKILGLIEHHALGDISTTEVPYVQVAPIGCAATLIYDLYKDCKVSVNKDMAIVMLSAILSDTVNLTSATTTEVDKQAVEELKKYAEMSTLDEYFSKMKDEKRNYSGMSDSEVFKTDYKEFEANGHKYGYASIEAKGEDGMKEIASKMLKYAASIYDGQSMEMFFIMVNESDLNKSYLYAYGNGADELLKKAYSDKYKDGYVDLGSVTSRKKVTPEIDKILSAQ